MALARQTQLRSKTSEGYDQFTTCWLEVDSRVSIGTVITLKGDSTLWTVVEQSEPIETKLLRTDWNVGGLHDTRAKQLRKKSNV